MGIAENINDLNIENENIYIPKEIKILNNNKNFDNKNKNLIKKILPGIKHSLFVSENDLFFTGDISKGAMGIKNEFVSPNWKIKNNIIKLTKITEFLPIKFSLIKSFYCSWHNSFILTSKKY
jgi:hypothetical protein